MKHCEHCNADIVGERAVCPLCGTKLTGGVMTDSEEVFARVPTVYAQYNLFFRAMIFASIVGAIVSVSANLILRDSGAWSVLVVIAIACVWLGMFIAVNKRRNIPKNLLLEMFLASAICFLWDLFTGFHGWSFDYVIPILAVSVTIAIGILTYVMKLGLDDIIIYMLIDALFGIMPIIFYAADLLNVVVPSIICFGTSLISITAVAVFRGELLISELKRKMHV